jgi:hypothetical protein
MRKAFHSPSMLVAIAAVVLALGGTGYAAGVARNSVGTAQLKNGAVTTVKLAPAASARIAGLTYRSASMMSDPRMGAVMTVPCPTGTTAIAGGAETPHTLNSFLLDSHPTNGRSWEVTVANGGDTPEQLTAWAVCAKVEGAKPQAAAAEGATIHRVALPR